MNKEGFLTLRPYQLMCIVCKIGEGAKVDLKDKKLNSIIKAVRKNPNIPMVLKCNTESVYKYQNPGKTQDTKEGGLYGEKQDLDILQKLGLVPGDVRPACELFERLLQNIKSSKGVCGYKKITSDTWKGCVKTESGFYEKGRNRGINAIIPPRSLYERKIAKTNSVKKMLSAKKLYIRPHHLLCAVCFYVRHRKPVSDDNLYEFIDIIRKNPDIPITLVRGCCMVCHPCKYYEPGTNLCIMKIGGGLRDDKKDLDVLQKLGLKFNDTIPARKLYGLIFKKTSSTNPICAYGDGVVSAPEWNICPDSRGAVKFGQAKKLFMKLFKRTQRS